MQLKTFFDYFDEELRMELDEPTRLKVVECIKRASSRMLGSYMSKAFEDREATVLQNLKDHQ